MAFNDAVLRSHQRFTSPFNLGFLSWGVECPLGFELDSVIISLLDSPQLSINEQLEPLKICLAKCRMTALDVVASEERSKTIWASLSLELDAIISELKYFLEPEFALRLEDFALQIKNSGTKATNEYSEKFLEFVQNQRGEIGLVAARNRFAEDLRVLCHSHNISKTVIDGSASFLDLPRNFDALHFVGTFNRATGRPLRQTRRIISSGIAEEIIFVRPSFAFELGPKTAFDRLFPALNCPSELEILSLGGAPPRSNRLAVDDALEENPQDAEALSQAEEHQSGPVDCRIVILPGSIGIPIEISSTRIAVLRIESRSQNVEVVWKHPFDELNEGDFVYATVEKNENKALRDYVVAERPDYFAEFLEKQNQWKNTISNEAEKIGWVAVENNLDALGAIRSHRARAWAAEDFIRPHSDDDYSALMKFSKFSDSEIRTQILLAKEFDSSLIRAGQAIGKRIWQSLDQIQLAKLRDGFVVELQISGLGAGLYVVGPVTNVSGNITSTTRNQVRRVVKVRGQN